MPAVPDRRLLFSSVFVQIPNGSIHAFQGQTTSAQIASKLNDGLASRVVAAEINGKVVDAFRPLGELADAAAELIHVSKSDNQSGGDGSSNEKPLLLRLLTDEDEEALDVLRRSAAHVVSRAVMRIFADALLVAISMTHEGFYCDIDLDTSISEEDFSRIESELQTIIALGERFERIELERDEARRLCDGLGQDFKVELIDTELANRASVCFYRHGEFVELCDGPHLTNTGKIGSIQLLHVAASPGESGNDTGPLQRLSGRVCFADSEEAGLIRSQNRISRPKRRVASSD
ncbi:MAG: TGS domain-containing protein [Planctomycetota bacterium]